jgi:membrane-bound lytic murein transglycosylase B
MGHYNMFEALATLGYDGRRAAFGRRELIAAMTMEQRENYQPKQMVSSWAGAFGETQFMPSTFLAQAVDGDGDARIDLWNSPADALASTASMLDRAGWHRGEPWFLEVTLPANFPYAEADAGNDQPIAHWTALGVKTALGSALPDSPAQGAIFVPAGAAGPAFLLFHNFHTILRYNNATSYALAVGYLAKRIAGSAPILHAWPRGEEPLSRDERTAFQQALKTLGYDPGAIDGIIGGHVRDALRAYQRAHDLTPDGFATQDLLKRMEREIAAKKG